MQIAEKEKRKKKSHSVELLTIKKCFVFLNFAFPRINARQLKIKNERDRKINKAPQHHLHKSKGRRDQK